MKLQKQNDITGILSPIMTSFDKDGNVYEKGCRNLVDYQLPHVNGFFVCGSYGSGPLMDLDERKKVLEIISEQANGKATIIAHVGCVSTKSAIELAKHAEKSGADAVGVTPFYYSHSEDHLLAFYKEIVESVTIPVYAYNNPKVSNNPISAKMLKKLSEIGISGIKDSNTNIVELVEKMYSIGTTDFSFITGTEALLFPAFMMGVKACIAGLANALPELVHDLYQSLIGQDFQRSRELQFKVNEARSILHYAPTISSIHAVLDYLGVDAGFPRNPFKKVNEQISHEIISAYKKIGVLI